jgi:hypothetical protein
MSEPERKRSIFEITIAHMLCSLGLVGVISCIAIPMFFSQPKITLDNATLLFAKDLRYGQNEAVFAGQSTYLELDSEGDGYSLVYSSGVCVPNPVGGDDLNRVYSFDAIFRGVEIKALDEESQKVTFSHSGFTLNSGRFLLTYKDGTRTVEIKKGSGQVTIEGLEREWSDNGF